MSGAARIGAHTFADVFCFADVEHFATCVEHPVHAGCRRRKFCELLDRRDPSGDGVGCGRFFREALRREFDRRLDLRAFVGVGGERGFGIDV